MKNYELDFPLERAIRIAEYHGACRDALNLLRDLLAAMPDATIGDFVDHVLAPKFATWWAFAVVYGRWPAGEAMIARDSSCHRSYLRFLASDDPKRPGEA